MEDEKVVAKFGNRLRLRVCGVCVNARQQLLMVKHSGLGNTHLWAPPGGGVKYAESTEAALKREFAEETGLQIAIEQFLFTHEFLAPPLHAIELFFTVSIKGGTLERGEDPEMEQEQIIQEVSFQPFEVLLKEHPENLHPALRNVSSLEAFLQLRGLHRFILS